jgi:hypothetical protein
MLLAFGSLVFCFVVRRKSAQLEFLFLSFASGSSIPHLEIIPLHARDIESRDFANADVLLLVIPETSQVPVVLYV